MKKLFSVLPLLLVVAACNQAPPAADASVIASGAKAWQAAFNAKDVDALAALYTSDSRVAPPNGEATIGRDAVRAEFGTMIDAGLGIELATVEAEVSGDIGYRYGTYVLQAGDETVDVGKYVETWRRGDDGQWRIANDIWNSDRPAAMAEPAKTHVMIMHEVDDAEKWLAAWRGEGSRHELFAQNGAKHVHTFRSADNSNLTGLVVAVNDIDALNAMLESEEGIAAAAEDGVRSDTLIVLSEAE
ncbi:MAG: DUF4440 domain-containing protein [Gammaproteobacteria bacterium]|nr:DUF4440 domain-containing protein [Gammaproteobacteria bacterium]MBU2676886.1 DUF4440 domain-containing protein [Gammaproteobacteria bacterium]NNC56701.1 DUF4440 domain-containing protein [Woeseiaceae bacterium]NNL50619.1 DUF4440 domain-containing protein [Woeseiaceae bacterium]